MKPKIKKPKIIKKLWGKEIVITNSPKYCGKILEFKKDHHSSLHYHKEKTETWFILKGKITLTNKHNKSITIKKNQIVHLEPNTIHMITALTNTQILEVSTQHHDEDTFRIQPSGKVLKEKQNRYKS